MPEKIQPDIQVYSMSARVAESVFVLTDLFPVRPFTEMTPENDDIYADARSAHDLFDCFTADVIGQQAIFVR